MAVECNAPCPVIRVPVERVVYDDGEHGEMESRICHWFVANKHIYSLYDAAKAVVKMAREGDDSYGYAEMLREPLKRLAKELESTRRDFLATRLMIDDGDTISDMDETEDTYAD